VLDADHATFANTYAVGTFGGALMLEKGIWKK
jgi:hypothetical protein